MGKTKTQNARRTDRLPNETSDCTVQALANVSGVPYAEAHRILAAQGRVERNGFSPDLAQTRKSFEGRFLVHEMPVGMTLAQFANNHWCGSFYVSIRKGDLFRKSGPQQLRGHMVAVVNGKVVDNLPKSWLRAKVRLAWEFERRLSFGRQIERPR